ncbi:peptidase M16 [Brevundimonas intermedia]|uniref:Peptidase M16 n=1 Tax=Brevundimonas intermedia TaxID=74315 RepID=A0ABQ5T7F4_9CAUL|nr:pitrilysin family protein [Brevundimonas intermedia]GLK48333.1 peptidase M16 [Brevundimonas intermedia]
MKTFGKPIAGAVLAALLSCGVSTAALAQARPELGQVRIPYETFTLPNGLTTLVYTDHTAPTVFVGVWYRIGSKDEPAGKTGFAHLFEHLMFQPTVHRPTEYFTPLEAVGATDINGSTTADYTNYIQTAPTNALDRALWMEADRMGHLTDGMTQALLDEQRAVVKNEKRQNELGPGQASEAQFLKGYYPAGHPYAHTTIGSMEDLDAATLDDVKAWFDANYGASNAVLVLAGDIDAATAREKVAFYFGGVRQGEPISRPDRWTPSIPDIRRDIVYENIPAAVISRTWPLSNASPRDNTLLQLAARAMAAGRGTPLHDALVEDLQLADDVSASVGESQLASAFTLSVALKPGVTPEAAGAALDRELAKFYAAGPNKDRLDEVVTATDISLLQTMESSAAIGAWLAEGAVTHDDPVYFLKQREWIGDVDAKAVARLTQAVLSRPYYELVQLPTPVPVAAPTVFADPKHMPEPGPADTTIAFPAVAEATLANGLKLVVAHRPNLPIVSASLQFSTGALAEDAYGRGTAGRAFGMLTNGSRRYDAEQLQREATRAGVNITAGAQSRQSAVTWTMLAARLDEGFGFAAEVVRRPTYPQAEIDKALDRVGPQFDAYERNPLQSAAPVYSRAIWGEDHPLGRIGTREDAKAVSRDEIQAFHDREIGPNNATLYLVGDITLDQARTLAQTHFGDWRRITPTPLNERAPATGLPGRIILVDAPGAAQTSVMVGELTTPFVADQAAAGSLADSILGAAFNSRLNMNLREEKGWTYGFTGGVSDTPVGPRTFTASGTVEADRTADAMAEIRKEITAYVTDRPATAEELERERTARVLALPSAFSGNSAFLSAITSAAAYGQPYDRAASSGARLAAVTLDQVQNVARQTYDPARLTWVVVGDLSRIETSVRALNYGSVEVWDVYGHKVR